MNGALLVVLAAMVTMALRRIAPVIAIFGAIVVVNSHPILGNPYGPIQLCIVIAMQEQPDQARRALEVIRSGSARCATSSRAGSVSPTCRRAAISRPSKASAPIR
ncbi:MULTISPECIES: hypothetical protein [unclassified Micromonospora]|uniref:hypothetical protein n=1 Tax=unclassified Micromonospora TaxID=2617518 RepID=UPI001C221076|nr:MULTISPECIES: hypothetical protein [unclassified Micromonospora]MBU8857791.1 hypothetical protein [Micromonospora sp. WMMB482]MDM4783421.1 hypothetical protein [Micromonospora sp. b486]